MNKEEIYASLLRNDVERWHLIELLTLPHQKHHFLAPVSKLKGKVNKKMSVVNLSWTAPAPVAPNPTDVVTIQIWDQVINPSFPIPNNMIGTVGAAVTTFKTPQLSPGVHNFTAVAVYGEGSSAPSNVLAETIVEVLAAPTNLTGTISDS